MRADFASIARLLASPARSVMVGALLEGRALTAGELARLAAIAPSTTSEHLDELVRGGLVVVTAQGRHRYFAVANSAVAEALEAFARICPELPVSSLRSSEQARALRRARTCYDHLAGALGVAILDAVVERRWLVPVGPTFELGPGGSGGFAELGVDVAAVRRQKRRLARPCLDWTERRSHLAGGLGAALAGSLLQRRWIERDSQHRALRVTPTGKANLRALLEVEA